MLSATGVFKCLVHLCQVLDISRTLGDTCLGTEPRDAPKGPKVINRNSSWVRARTGETGNNEDSGQISQKQHIAVLELVYSPESTVEESTSESLFQSGPRLLVLCQSAVIAFDSRSHDCMGSWSFENGHTKGTNKDMTIEVR